MRGGAFGGAVLVAVVGFLVVFCIHHFFAYYLPRKAQERRDRPRKAMIEKFQAEERAKEAAIQAYWDEGKALLSEAKAYRHMWAKHVDEVLDKVIDDPVAYARWVRVYQRHIPHGIINPPPRHTDTLLARGWRKVPGAGGYPRLIPPPGPPPPA